MKFHQFKAMFKKRLINSLRDKKAVITQFLLPLIMTIIGLTLAKIVPSVEDEPSRLLNFRNLSVDGKLTVVFLANFTSNPKFTLQVICRCCKVILFSLYLKCVRLFRRSSLSTSMNNNNGNSCCFLFVCLFGWLVVYTLR